MDALLVAFFHDGARAGEGARLLRALDAEGALSLYAAAAVVRPPMRGAGVVAREPVHAGGGSAAAPAVGAAVGALMDLVLAPPVAAATAGVVALAHRGLLLPRSPDGSSSVAARHTGAMQGD